MSNKRIAILTEAFNNANGVARIMINLMQGFVDRGYSVDLVHFATGGPFEQFIPEEVNIIDLGKQIRIRKSIEGVSQYLRQTKPSVLYCSDSDRGVEAIIAKTLAMSSTPVVISIPSMESQERPAFMTKKDKWHLRLKRLLCRFATKIVPVSQGVADEVTTDLMLPKRKVQVVYNPVINEQLRQDMQKSADHPWLQEKTIPVILAAGRLHAVKDYGTLLHALKHVVEQCPARLIILGEGPEREKLEELIQELELENCVDLPGFTDNPYAYMKQADVFALSSKLEGLPTVIIEAMACGCPIVSTNCPGGLNEILKNGDYGTLVPVGDYQALGQAIVAALGKEHDLGKLKKRAEDFSEDKIINEYLELFQLK